MSSARSLAAIAAGSLLLCGARPAAAQTALWDVSAGYVAMRDATDHVTFPLGVSAGTSVALLPWLAVVGDLDRERATVPLLGTSSAVLTSSGVLAGARASGRIGVFTEFGQFLAGRVSTSGTSFGTSSSAHYVAVQPGAGLEYHVRARLALRAEADVRWFQTARNIRVVATLVYRLR